MGRKLALAAAIIVLLAGASVAVADPPPGHNPQGRMLGVVTPKGGGQKTTGGSTLLYHGGALMNTNATYAIFWDPSGSAFPLGYTSLINQFLADVAHDSGRTTNVYAVATQYNVLYSSSVGGVVPDTDPYPAKGCRDHYTTVCLTDAQLQSELRSVINANHLPTGTTTAYLIFTPPNVGSCAGGCSFRNWCAYHSWIGTGDANTILYANLPYQDQTQACDGGQHPNGNSADATIDALSHEHNEMITDPVGTGWFTKNGYEEADLCNFVYGSPLGGASGSEYNQVINTDHYFIQEEWSNASSSCVQHYP